MGKYDDAAKRAGEAVLKEFASDIEELKTTNLERMFPNITDQKLARELIAAVNKATEKNELMTAFAVFGAKASAAGISAMRDGIKLAKKLLV